jgi:indole-3-glycerol phosphate synthase
MSQNILKKIVEKKVTSLSLRKQALPLEELIKKVENKVNSDHLQKSFFESLQEYKKSGVLKNAIIAEVKRRSPSKGPLRPELNPIDLALEYQAAGARAISVLTEEDFFAGSDDDLQAVLSRSAVPALRKDFTIDAYQIWESKLLGASAILLIAAILSGEEIIQFSNLAKELELDVLVEVHNFEETKKALEAKPRILGVNNRNLQTFEVDLKTSEDIIAEFGQSSAELWVSESGIFSLDDISRLTQSGFEAFLIGESLLKSESPGQKLKELVG